MPFLSHKTQFMCYINQTNQLDEMLNNTKEGLLSWITNVNQRVKIGIGIGIESRTEAGTGTGIGKKVGQDSTLTPQVHQLHRSQTS